MDNLSISEKIKRIADRYRPIFLKEFGDSEEQEVEVVSNDRGLAVYADGEVYVNGIKQQSAYDKAVENSFVSIDDMENTFIFNPNKIYSHKIDWGTKEPEIDPVKPQHYRKGEVDLIETWYLKYPFDEFRAVMQSHIDKYIYRDKENRVQDLEKAIYMLKRLKEKEEARDIAD